MENRLLTLLIGYALGLPSFGQYTNDWINPNQQYYKIQVVEDGWYRVTNTELVSAGVPISTINPDRVQLFRNGQEVAIFRESSSNLLTAFEFYGQKNDGSLDTELYSAANEQPNRRYSLFTDTASYFFTWNLTQSGKRIATNTNQAKTVAQEPYFLEKLLVQQASTYSEGQKYGQDNELSSGTFAAGEGWTGAAIGKTGTQSFSFDLPSKVTSGAKPSVSVLLAGGNNQNHNIEISVGPTTSTQRVIATVNFTGYRTQTSTTEFEWTDVGADNKCVVVVRAVGFAGIEERISVSYVELTYAKQFALSGPDFDLFDLQSTTNDRYVITIPTTNATNTRIYNVADPYTVVRHVTASFSDRLEVVLGSDASTFVAVTSPKTVPWISRAVSTYLNPGTANYLIVSHPQLRLPSTTGQDQVAAYEAYRESVIGGGFQVYAANIQDIYDQFGYGNPSPLAIRKYFEFAVSTSSVQYGLLIGKGVNLTFGYGRAGISTPHFVPTFGYPGSDALFSAKIGQDETRFPVGRVNATSPEEVADYLSKVKAMEAQGYNELWRKNFIHLSGGQNQFELTSFYATISNYSNIVESDFVGGKASIRRKETSDPVESIIVTDEVNKGVSMITFFGHSGSFTQDVEIGNPRREGNPKGFTNTGKYPVLLMNGCNSGSIFDSNDSYIDDWVMVKNLGAIAGIAHVDFATSQSLRNFSNLFYDIAFRRSDSFGMSVGQIHQQVMAEYFDSLGNSLANESILYGMLIIGDPAVKVFGADKPDYAIGSADVYVSNEPDERPLSTSADFPLFIVVRNYGRTVTDSLLVKVDRTLPDGQILSYIQRFLRPLYQDTLRFEIENGPGYQYDGQNNLLVTLDPDNATPELNEVNNQVSLNLFLAKGSTINLFPVDYGIVSTPGVTLKFQSVDFLSEEQGYSLEMDTTTSFSSPFFRNETLTGSLFLTRQIDLSALSDSTIIYWRTRFAEPQSNEDTSWVNSSFMLLRGSQDGWALSSARQFTEQELSGLSLDSESGNWAFDQSEATFNIVVYGRDTPGNYTYNQTYSDFQVVINGNDLIITDLGPAANPLCRTDVMGAVFLDRESALPMSPFGLIPDEINNPIVCGQQPQLIFNLTETDILGTNRYLDSLISLLDPGDGMLFFTLGDVSFSNWDAETKASLNQVGIRTSTIEALVDGQPAIFYGKKGGADGTAIEIISNGTGIPLPDQLLDYSGTFAGTYSSGTIRTGRIGPAKEWSSLNYDVEERTGDQLFLVVTGISPNGTEGQLFEGNRLGNIDLSTVDAVNYPFIRLQLAMEDQALLTPPKLNSLSVIYTPTPDGMLVSPNRVNDELPEGREYTRPFGFVNISDEPFEDSVSVTFTLANVTSGTTYIQQLKGAGPGPGDTLRFEASFSTIGKVGENNLSVFITSEETETYPINNQLIISQALTVTQDEINPVLDVTFDGAHILDGDIVSPRPAIRIRFRDENPHLFKTDTAGLAIALKEPCESCQFEPVHFTDPKLTYTVADEDQDFEIQYSPGPLEDGDYAIRVQVADQTGNQSGTEPFEINFKVINESTITHFFPYPNPFSTSTRFVFTLTGSELPDEIKIQIMTVTGRVVREITQDELGPIKIGQNISQYAWDGRDEYGDQLANGVYLYKVYIRAAGQSPDHRFTSADRAFKNGFGKIYLLR